MPVNVSLDDSFSKNILRILYYSVICIVVQNVAGCPCSSFASNADHIVTSQMLTCLVDS